MQQTPSPWCWCKNICECRKQLSVQKNSSAEWSLLSLWGLAQRHKTCNFVSLCREQISFALLSCTIALSVVTKWCFDSFRYVADATSNSKSIIDQVNLEACDCDGAESQSKQCTYEQLLFWCSLITLISLVFMSSLWKYWYWAILWQELWPWIQETSDFNASLSRPSYPFLALSKNIHNIKKIQFVMPEKLRPTTDHCPDTHPR